FGAFGEFDGYVRRNEYGVIVFYPAGDTLRIDNLAQYFRNGEIWGINADVLRQGERGQQRWLLSRSVEKTFAESLNLFLEFMRIVSNLAPPYSVEMGIQGVKNWMLVINGTTLASAGVMAEDRIQFRKVLNTIELKTQDKLLLEFFNMMYDQTGHP